MNARPGSQDAGAFFLAADRFFAVNTPCKASLRHSNDLIKYFVFFIFKIKQNVLNLFFIHLFH